MRDENKASEIGVEKPKAGGTNSGCGNGRSPEQAGFFFFWKERGLHLNTKEALKGFPLMGKG